MLLIKAEGEEKMKALQESKKLYDSIEIPKELSQVVENSIRQMEQVRKENGSKTGQENLHPFPVKKKKIMAKRMALRSVKIAAAMVICFTMGLNSSQTFAGQMSELPVIGVLARVLTVRSYEESNEETGINVAVNMPGVEAKLLTEEAAQAKEAAAGQSDEALAEKEGQGLQPSLVTDVNAEIERIVAEHLAKSEEDFLAYREAFFAAGGTEEEWAGRTMDVYVDYEIKYQDEARVSFVLYLVEAWSASEEQRYYYNLELLENRRLTLEELLGPDYVELANRSIFAQMEERMAADENYVYWGSERDEEGTNMEAFTTVDENTDFYINEKGNPVITFPEYEIAPGFMGVQEFEIVK